jgi:hypothetical protein
MGARGPTRQGERMLMTTMFAVSKTLLENSARDNGFDLDLLLAEKGTSDG